MSTPTCPTDILMYRRYLIIGVQGEEILYQNIIFVIICQEFTAWIPWMSRNDSLAYDLVLSGCCHLVGQHVLCNMRPEKSHNM